MSKEDLLSEPIVMRWFQPHKREEMIRILREKGSLMDHEVQLKTKTGKIKYCSITAVLLPDQDMLEGTVIDITKRKEAEAKLKESEEKLKELNDVLEQRIHERTQELKESEEKWRSLVSNAPDIVFSADLDGKIEYINTTLSGIPVDDVIGKTVFDFTPKNYHDIIKGTIERVIQTGEADMYELKLENPNGKPSWFSNRIGPIMQNGNVISLLFISSDITDRKIAELQIKESEEKFRNISEQSLMGIAIFQDYKVIYVNERVSKILGYSIEELYKWDINEIQKIVHPEDLPRIIEIATKRMKSEWDLSPIQRFRLITKNGEIKWIDSYNNRFEHGGKPANLITVIDISERVFAEEKFRSISEQALMAIGILQDGLVKYVNQAASDLLEYPLEEMLNWKSEEFVKGIHPEDLPSVLEHVRRKQKGDPNVTTQYSYRLITKTHKTKWVDNYSKTINYDGKPANFVSIIDITERKVAEEALRESEEKYRRLVEDMQDGVIVSQDFRFKFINQSFAKMIGYTVEEILGTNLSDYVMDEDLGMVKERYIKRQAGEQIPKEYVVRGIHKKGKILQLNISSTIITYEGRIATMGTVKDISERIEAEKQLKESEIRYKEAYNRAEFYKDLLSHDIGNIFQNILSATELCYLYLNNPEKLETKLNKINEQIKRCSRLNANVRKLSRLDETSPTLQPVDLSRVLNNAKQFIFDSFPEQKIEIKVQGLDPNYKIQANELLFDVFENLMNNSIKHNLNQNVEISIRIAEVEHDNRKMIKVEFLDNGMGIPDNMKINIFQRGYREDKNVRGSGLGLSLLKKILENYHGDILVRDRVTGDYSKGSNFTLLIPEAA